MSWTDGGGVGDCLDGRTVLSTKKGYEAVPPFDKDAWNEELIVAMTALQMDGSGGFTNLYDEATRTKAKLPAILRRAWTLW